MHALNYDEANITLRENIKKANEADVSGSSGLLDKQATPSMEQKATAADAKMDAAAAGGPDATPEEPSVND